MQVYAAGMSESKSLLIVYHSMTGGTRQMAESARAGAAADASVEVRLLHASQAGPDEVLAADGLIFATPENFAAMSGQLKDFFDRSYYGVLGRVNGPSLCQPDLRRQRREQRGQADRAHRHGLAPQAHCRAADRVHACADGASHFGAQAHFRR